MSFEAFYLDIVKYRSNLRTAFTKPAALIVWDYVISHKINFDSDADFKEYVNSLREKSIDDLQDDANRVFQDREDLEDFINHKDDHHFIGTINNKVIYTFNPPREERW